MIYDLMSHFLSQCVINIGYLYVLIIANYLSIISRIFRENVEQYFEIRNIEQWTDLSVNIYKVVLEIAARLHRWMYKRDFPPALILLHGYVFTTPTNNTRIPFPITTSSSIVSLDFGRRESSWVKHSGLVVPFIAICDCSCALLELSPRGFRNVIDMYLFGSNYGLFLKEFFLVQLLFRVTHDVSKETLRAILNSRQQSLLSFYTQTTQYESVYSCGRTWDSLRVASAYDFWGRPSFPFGTRGSLGNSVRVRVRVRITLTSRMVGRYGVTVFGKFRRITGLRWKFPPITSLREA